MGSKTAEKELCLEPKKEKNKALLFVALICWSVCFVSYAYQYLGWFVNWPYWCLIHLISLACPITTIATDAPPKETPLCLVTKLFFFLAALSMPLFTMTLPPPVRPTDCFYMAVYFMAVDIYASSFVASLRRRDYTFYWQLICLVSGFALSSAYGLQGVANPLWCKVAVSFSALAVAALSTLYLHLNETIPHLALPRCSV